MVSLDKIKQANSTLKSYGPGLVGVFVGGTSGIGEATARSFVRHAVSPRIYLIGRNEAQASKIIADFKALNPESTTTFLKCEVSLLKNVDEVCTEIQKEEKVHVLLFTSGSMPSRKRDESAEGLDKTLALHYYARMRFIANLLPQLTAAASPIEGEGERQGETKPGLASAISVLEPGGEGEMIRDDLSLKTHYSLSNARTHAITMTRLSLSHLATSNPTVSFTHSFPGVVRTGIIRDMGLAVRLAIRALWVLARPWMVTVAESGERHLYAAVGLKSDGGAGTAGEKAHLVGADSEPRGNWGVLERYQAEGMGEVVWGHTEDVFREVCG
ncbi:uncharacterized protein DSM5745_10454 [Aspergillus mulundensis]|uniref:Uncharacterized protein n=1 Tax=Aspergillus mulundensis TaxID=1810919 RepID=A0A3D8QIY3_9EURO|nr:Uncharacterized protein DSM5745_10454 [Aspergillus mulundensis]RDW61782.1 Uncharacterized protein DSM5745_10454 [Aspergillus mulundensis]